MKKLILFLSLVLTAAALFTLGGCALTEDDDTLPTAAVTEQTTDNTAAPTAAPVSIPEEIASLLPDWPAASVEGSRVYFRDVEPESLAAYAASLQAKGYTLLAGEEGGYYYALYNEDSWVEIEDTTNALKTCYITGYRGNAADGEAYSALEPAPVCALDETPEGVYEATGLKVCRCLFSAEEGAARPYTQRVYLCGGDVAIPASISQYVICDMDGNGSRDILTMSDIDMSGMFGQQFVCYGVFDGAPRVIGSSLYMLTAYGSTGLELAEGKPRFTYAAYSYTTGQTGEPLGFGLCLDRGSVVFENGVEEASFIAGWGGSPMAYSSYPYYDGFAPEQGFEVYATLFDGEYLFVLIPVCFADHSPATINSMPPIPAEDASAMLESYGVTDSGLLAVYLLDGAFRTEGDLAPAPEEETALIRSLLIKD